MSRRVAWPTPSRASTIPWKCGSRPSMGRFTRPRRPTAPTVVRKRQWLPGRKASLLPANTGVQWLHTVFACIQTLDLNDGFSA